MKPVLAETKESRLGQYPLPLPYLKNRLRVRLLLHDSRQKEIALRLMFP